MVDADLGVRPAVTSRPGTAGSGPGGAGARVSLSSRAGASQGPYCPDVLDPVACDAEREYRHDAVQLGHQAGQGRRPYAPGLPRWAQCRRSRRGSGRSARRLRWAQGGCDESAAIGGHGGFGVEDADEGADVPGFPGLLKSLTRLACRAGEARGGLRGADAAAGCGGQLAAGRRAAAGDLGTSVKGQPKTSFRMNATRSARIIDSNTTRALAATPDARGSAPGTLPAGEHVVHDDSGGGSQPGGFSRTAIVARSQRLDQLAEARRSSRSSAWPDSTPVRISRATASSSATCGLVSE